MSVEGPPRRLEGSFRIGAEHPCLDGHFPGHPLVPGVVLLDEILALLRPLLPSGLVPGFDSVKFLGPVLPDRLVAVEMLLAGPTGRFSATVEGVTVCSGTVRLA
jgi:3-hydroxymyristoyl/3-hydroxydecanoyl-(acyl carrier protein) dehydratase